MHSKLALLILSAVTEPKLCLEERAREEFIIVFLVITMAMCSI